MFLSSKFINSVVFSIVLSCAASVAQAQDFLSINPGTTSVGAGAYYRVEAKWPMLAEATYLVSFPALLDGYYFGVDAPRQLVTGYQLQADGSYEVTVEDMDEDSDFIPHSYYLITPSIQCDSIIHIIPGIKTEVEATTPGHELLFVEYASASASLDRHEFERVIGTPIFDLSGNQVEGITPGKLYIINGKTVTFQ